MTEVLRVSRTLQHGDGPARFTELKIVKTEVYGICKSKICHVFQQLRGYSDAFVLVSLWHGVTHILIESMLDFLIGNAANLLVSL